MTSSPAMRVKGRRLITYHYDVDDPDRLSYEEEEVWEPVDEPVKPGEFQGVAGTMALPHGQPPVMVEGHTWEVYKIYEKQTIWISRVHEKEVSV